MNKGLVKLGKHLSAIGFEKESQMAREIMDMDALEDGGNDGEFTGAFGEELQGESENIELDDKEYFLDMLAELSGSSGEEFTELLGKLDSMFSEQGVEEEFYSDMLNLLEEYGLGE